MQIERDVLNVLDRSERHANTVKLTEQLDRALYLRTNKVLNAAGGKWNRKQACHVFDGDATDRIDQIILTGSVVVPKDEFDYFPTPDALAAEMVRRANIRSGDRVLEPSAGCGRIVRAMPQPQLITAIEINPEMAHQMHDARLGVHVICKDFACCGEELGMFDRIVMNPPFRNQQDLRHATHALSFLRDGGNLISIMSAGVLFRENRATVEFRELVRRHRASFEELPDNTFKESGTGVRTVMLMLIGKGCPS